MIFPSPKLTSFILDKFGPDGISGRDFLKVFGRQVDVFEAFVGVFVVFPGDPEEVFDLFGQADSRARIRRQVNPGQLKTAGEH